MAGNHAMSMSQSLSSTSKTAKSQTANFQTQRTALGKSASANSLTLLRSQMLQHEPFWRNQRELSEEERETLEGTWDQRHWMHFSRMNNILSPTCRDYFDRPREIEGDNSATVKNSSVRLLPSWSLGHEPRKFSDMIGPPKNRGDLGRSCSGLPGMEKKEQGWDNRFHLTHSAANHHYHDSDREYFSLFQQPRSKRVIPKTRHGLTAHIFHRRRIGDPDGADEPPPLRERFLRPGNDMPVPKVPGHVLHKLSMTL
eukprot:TRINITY_DN62417_c0_g1_i1.p1 TRINITY_DN62417_c0_g1~~TRINITY_DN62417_c0_g1_i1.p1  ORF type:complete len:255 (+),score=29.72 TRINITY_DN62417_c0_g1_i1:115-879(+)